MNVLDAIRERQSIRAYQTREIEPEKLETLLAAANQAPSAANLQAYHIYVVRNEQMKQGLVEAAAGQKFLAGAPLVLVFCADPARAASKFGPRGEQVYAVQDACAAVSNAMLAAVELGLGSCWVDAVDAVRAARVVGCAPGHHPVVLLPIGYPAETPPRTPRRTLADLTTAR